MFSSKAGTYRMKNLPCAPDKGRLLALPTNIKLVWKGLSGTNTLAYYKHLQITAVRRVVCCNIKPWSQSYKTFSFSSSFILSENKLECFVPDKHLQPTLMLVSNDRSLPLNVPPVRSCTWVGLQTLDLAVKACQGQTL
jgi:hypothetical protein